MKNLFTIITAILLVGCGNSEQSTQQTANTENAMPPTAKELLASIGTPLNEKEKIIADRKYVEKLINDPSTRPSETINRANHTYSILYIIDEERIFVHGVWMIKGDTFYYMELISDGSEITEEEREVLSAKIISLEEEKGQLSVPPADEDEKEIRITWEAIDQFKEKEMQIFNDDQANKNFNIFKNAAN